MDLPRREPQASPWFSLTGALCAGLALRLWSVAWGYGYVANDDFFHYLEPAWNWLRSGVFLIPSDFRSAGPSLIIYGGMRLGHALGITAAHRLVQFSYGVLGVGSLASVVAAHRLARWAWDERVAVGAAWVMAVLACMPRISTRALPEAMCIPWLLWGLYALGNSVSIVSTRRMLWAAWAGVLLGTSVMLRLQTVAAAPGAVMAVVYLGRRNGIPFVKVLLWASVGLLFPLMAQGLVDLWTLGEFLAYPRRYLAFNLEFASDYGREPWYTYLGVLTLYLVPPWILGMAQPLWRAALAHPLVSGPLLTFVLVHMATPHKEDRYMVPAVALAVVLVGKALADFSNGKGWMRVTARAWWITSVAAGLFLSASDEFPHLTGPLVEVSAEESVLVLGWGTFKLPTMMAGDHAQVLHADTEELLLPQLPANPPRHARWVSNGAPTPGVAHWLAENGYTCQDPTRHAAGLVDQILYAVNPSHNQRRAPSWVVDCYR